jgi:hypothetical protein
VLTSRDQGTFVCDNLMYKELPIVAIFVSDVVADIDVGNYVQVTTVNQTVELGTSRIATFESSVTDIMVALFWLP